MDPRSFVDEISRLAPSVSQLEAVGLRKNDIATFRASFIAEERDGNDDAEGDALLQLLKRWDVTRIEIGMLRFLARPEQLGRNTCVGYVEADPLFLVEDTREVVVEDLDAPGHILWFVAETGSALLDALVPAARLLAQRAVGDADFDDNDAAHAVAEECASLAGGRRFWQFYAMLLSAT